MDTTLCPGDFQAQAFVSTWKTKIKLTAKARLLFRNYEIFMLSLRSLLVMCLKGKLKDRMARIEETDSDPSESVIPGIETLHFTSSMTPTSIAVLGRNQICPVDM